LVGVRQFINYEAQAAIELESLVDPEEQGMYAFDVTDPAEADLNSMIVIQPGPLFHNIVRDFLGGTPIPTIAARFHNGLAYMILQVTSSLRNRYGITPIALSGGVWQNLTLLQKTLSLLHGNGFEVYVHHQVPTNDGGVSLGQAVVASVNLLNL